MTAFQKNFELKIKEGDIKVNMKLVKNTEVAEKAIATLVLGPIKIAGFRVLEGKYQNKEGDYLWVTPPSYRGRNGKFHKTFWIEDKEIWYKIGEKILQKYNELIMKESLREDDIPVVEDKK